MTQQPSHRFTEYCRHKEQAAIAAVLSPYRTVTAAAGVEPLVPIGSDWSRALFEGDFYRSPAPFENDLPVVNLVFVQSHDGNTSANNPSSLGGGATDKHLIYEGLSRIDADAVLSGATTAKVHDLVFSVWHPELVSLRLQRGHSRHPAQVIVSSRSALSIETGLMFQEPELRVLLMTTSNAATSLRLQVATRPWIEVIDAGQPLSMQRGLHELKSRGIATVSAIGGRRTATALLDERLVQDLYLTTAPTNGGEPDTPMYKGEIDAVTVLEKAGTGNEEGVRFVHSRLRPG